MRGDFQRQVFKQWAEKQDEKLLAAVEELEPLHPALGPLMEIHEEFRKIIEA